MTTPYTPALKYIKSLRAQKLAVAPPPGTEIMAKLELQVQHNQRQFDYTKTVTADDNGRYVLTVPYPTKGDISHSDVVATGPYQLYIKMEGQNDFDYHSEFDVNLSQVDP